MKKTIIFSFAIVFLTFFGNFTQATAQSTQADAEYELIRYQYNMYNDSSMDINFRKELKIIRNRAMTAYADKGETFILYNPAFETLTINESYTLRPDSTKVETPQNAFVDQLPSNCANCGRYNGLREMAVIHTGLEYGAIIVLDYTIHRKSNILEKQFIPQQDCPVKKFEVIVDLPKNQELNYNFYQPEYLKKYTDYEVNDEHTYHITLQDLPQTFVDSYLPSATQLYYTLSLSNHNTPALIYTPHDDTITGAEDLLATPNQDNPKEYVQALRNYVVDYVNYNNITPALLNYQHSTAAQVWKSNCGTIMDKAVLLCSLLHQTGYTATVIPGTLAIAKNITLSAPEQTFVQVTINEMNYLMSPIRKDELKLQGEARDEVHQIRIDSVLAYQPIALATNISDGTQYLRLKLPQDFNIDPTLLTSVRTAPLQTELTDREYHYTIILPTGVKIVDKNLTINRELKSLGSMKITIRQRGKKLYVKRKIKIEQEIIVPNKKDHFYDTFRQMMIDWDQYSEIIVRKSK